MNSKAEKLCEEYIASLVETHQISDPVTAMRVKNAWIDGYGKATDIAIDIVRKMGDQNEPT